MRRGEERDMTMEHFSVGHHDEQDEDGEKQKKDLWINGYVFPSPRYVDI